MDKARRPHVIRTWTVERTKVPYRPPQPAHLRPESERMGFHPPAKRVEKPVSPPNTSS
jgi:hypothetical protein